MDPGGLLVLKPKGSPADWRRLKQASCSEQSPKTRMGRRQRQKASGQERPRWSMIRVAVGRQRALRTWEHLDMGIFLRVLWPLCGEWTRGWEQSRKTRQEAGAGAHQRDAGGLASLGPSGFCLTPPLNSF